MSGVKELAGRATRLAQQNAFLRAENEKLTLQVSEFRSVLGPMGLGGLGNLRTEAEVLRIALRELYRTVIELRQAGALDLTARDFDFQRLEAERTDHALATAELALRDRVGGPEPMASAQAGALARLLVKLESFEHEATEVRIARTERERAYASLGSVAPWQDDAAHGARSMEPPFSLLRIVAEAIAEEGGRS